MIEVKHIWFSYEQWGEFVLKDISFSVEKGEEGGRTFTHVCLLDRAQRRQELARLTGGARLTEAMLSGAEELLAGAEEFKKSL